MEQEEVGCHDVILGITIDQKHDPDWAEPENYTSALAYHVL